MGDMADMIESQMWDNDEFFEPRHPPAPSRGEWIQKNGKAIRIADMDTNHLINTIRMLERKGKPSFGPKIKELRAELGKRPNRRPIPNSEIIRHTKLKGTRPSIVIMDDLEDVDFGDVEHLPEDSIDLTGELG